MTLTWHGGEKLLTSGITWARHLVQHLWTKGLQQVAEEFLPSTALTVTGWMVKRLVEKTDRESPQELDGLLSKN